MDTKPTEAKQYEELIPAEGTEDVGKKVFQLLEEIMRDKDALNLPQKAKRNYEIVNNKFWKQESSSLPLATANLIFTHVQRIVNQLTDNAPTFNVVPIGDVGDAYEESLYNVLQTIKYWWNETEQQSIFSISVKNGETNGTTIEKYFFNPELRRGEGEVAVDNVDLFHFGFWPLDARSIDDCEAVFHFRPYDVRDVRRIWGAKANDVVNDEDIIKQLGDDRRTVVIGKTDTSSHSGTIGGVVKSLLSSGKATDGIKDQVLVVECWVKDRTRTKIEKITESGDVDGEVYVTKEIVEKPKYTGEIRRIITCNMGKVVLEDRDNPSINPLLPDEVKMNLYLFDRFPFGTAQSITDQVSIWGRTDLDQLIPLQTEINKTITSIMYFKDKSARPKAIVPKDSGVSPTEMNNAMGVITPHNSIVAQGLRWFPAPESQVDLMQTLETLKAWFFLIAGTFEMDQANLAGNDVVAYKAINALLERAAAMQRSKERNYSRLVRERGRAYLSLAQSWYTEDRWIAVEEAGTQKPVKINASQLRVPVTVAVVSGSTLPISNVQRREEALMLFQTQAIDHEELLKRLDWPDYMDVVNRVKAGPVGEVMQRAQAAGMPEPLVGFLQQLSEMKADKFENALKRGELPDFMSVLQQALTGQPPKDPKAEAEAMKIQAESMEKQANAQKAGAEVAKIQQEIMKAKAEAMLTAEKIITERFERMVKTEGVKMDWKKLEQEDAVIASDIEIKNKQMEHDAARLVTEMETGIKQHDIELKKTEVEMKKVEVTKDAKRNEKGIKSNNEE